MELERKQFPAGFRSVDECVARAGFEFEAVTGYRLSGDFVRSGVLSCELDARQAPAKLLRQAFGLVKAAQVRGDGVLDPEVELLFARLCRRVLGRSLDLTQKVRRVKRRSFRD